MNALHWNAPQYKTASKKRDKHIFPLKRVKNLNLEYKGESDFLVVEALTRGGNNNNNKASERPETSRAREKIDLGVSEMRP